MHTVHGPTDTSGVVAGLALGIMFDTTEYTADLSAAEQSLIDNFFDSLNWENDDPVVDLITYGNLM